MQIKIELSEENEGTSEPYWLILAPLQNMRADIHALAGQITGPFFSRKSADDHLNSRRYAFASTAGVYCMSGYWSKEYKAAVKAAGGLG